MHFEHIKGTSNPMRSEHTRHMCRRIAARSGRRALAEWRKAQKIASLDPDAYISYLLRRLCTSHVFVCCHSLKSIVWTTLRFEHCVVAFLIAGEDSMDQMSEQSLATSNMPQIFQSRSGWYEVYSVRQAIVSLRTICCLQYVLFIPSLRFVISNCVYLTGDYG